MKLRIIVFVAAYMLALVCTQARIFQTGCARRIPSRSKMKDHSYGQILEAQLVPGDPLQVIRELAKQVAAKGVKRIEGRILVDVSLFPEATREGGSGVVISPVSVNDNVIDVIMTPGRSPGRATSLQASPVTKYASFQNEVKIGSQPTDRPPVSGTHVMQALATG